MSTKIALEIIKKFEGCRLKAYPDPATGAEPITIGWGSTAYEDGTKIKLGDHITQEKADNMLFADTAVFNLGVLASVKSSINEHQLAALTSFAYNCGLGNLRKSTLLKKVNINPSDKTIRDEFMRWNKANGKVMAGLTKRRAEEANLYFT